MSSATHYPRSTASLEVPRLQTLVVLTKAVLVWPHCGMYASVMCSSTTQHKLYWETWSPVRSSTNSLPFKVLKTSTRHPERPVNEPYKQPVQSSTYCHLLQWDSHWNWQKNWHRRDKNFRSPEGYTLNDHKVNEQIWDELKVYKSDKIIVDYRWKWTQHSVQITDTDTPMSVYRHTQKL